MKNINKSADLSGISPLGILAIQEVFGRWNAKKVLRGISEILEEESDQTETKKSPKPVKDYKPSKIHPEDLQEFPGIIKAWNYRGRIWLQVAESELSSVKKFFADGLSVLRKAGSSFICATRWIAPEAYLKQSEEANARETRKLRKQFEARIKWLVSCDMEDRATEEKVGDLEYWDEFKRQEQEDLLDDFGSVHSYEVQPGMAGYLYKEDLDLEGQRNQEKLPNSFDSLVGGLARRGELVHLSP